MQPPPPHPNFGPEAFLRGAGVLFEAPRGRIFIPPPLFYSPPTPRRVFSACIKFRVPPLEPLPPHQTGPPGPGALQKEPKAPGVGGRGRERAGREGLWLEGRASDCNGGWGGTLPTPVGARPTSGGSQKFRPVGQQIGRTRRGLYSRPVSDFRVPSRKSDLRSQNPFHSQKPSSPQNHCKTLITLLRTFSKAVSRILLRTLLRRHVVA